MMHKVKLSYISFLIKVDGVRFVFVGGMVDMLQNKNSMKPIGSFFYCFARSIIKLWKILFYTHSLYLLARTEKVKHEGEPHLKWFPCTLDTILGAIFMNIVYLWHRFTFDSIKYQPCNLYCFTISQHPQKQTFRFTARIFTMAAL